MDIDNLVETIERDGFVILRKVINEDLIIKTQSYAADFLECNRSTESIIEAMEKLESIDRSSFYELCKRMGQVPSVVLCALQNDVMSLVERILNVSDVHLVDSGVFFNKLTVKRLQYDWHQENSYFPNAKEVLTLWYPWLHEVNEKNGTMVMAKGGHKTKHHAERINLKQGLTQMKISEERMANFEKVQCNLELGDAVLFTFNSPHRTGYNSTDTPRTTIITRFTDKVGKYKNGWVPVSY